MRGAYIGVKTPLLVPSFSSKALDDVCTVFETLQPDITDSFLVSAYDIHHNELEVPSGAAAEVLFLDSGGYEVSMDSESGEPIYGLVSAYDIHHNELEVPSGAAAEVLFLDSGGYEVSMDSESGEPIYGQLATLRK